MFRYISTKTNQSPYEPAREVNFLDEHLVDKRVIFYWKVEGRIYVDAKTILTCE